MGVMEKRTEATKCFSGHKDIWVFWGIMEN